MSGIHSEAEKHHLIGGALCLDFANTLNGYRKGRLHEYLPAYRDLVIWSRKAEILTDPEAKALLRLAGRRPGAAAAALQRAHQLRSTISRIFSSKTYAVQPKASDLARLNALRSTALSRSHLVRTESGFRLDWTGKNALDRMLCPIVMSAADLLTSESLARVHVCDGDICDWLFVDTSRNHLRRWCSMDECGNRAKVRRFLERKYLATHPFPRSADRDSNSPGRKRA
jgi:predicted RNA-binding Zn ribbon-like protein